MKTQIWFLLLILVDFCKKRKNTCRINPMIYLEFTVLVYFIAPSPLELKKKQISDESPPIWDPFPKVLKKFSDLSPALSSKGWGNKVHKNGNLECFFMNLYHSRETKFKSVLRLKIFFLSFLQYSIKIVITFYI